MNRILVAVDGSEASLHAVRFAGQLAKGGAVDLAVIYVSPPNLLPPHVYADVIEQIEKEERKFAAELLGKAAAEAKAAGATRCEQISVTGVPAEALADVAEKDPSVSMVVVGSRGRGAVARVMLGSVADRLVHICKKPVLVVR